MLLKSFLFVFLCSIPVQAEIITEPISIHDQGQIRFEYDYDNVTMIVARFRCINNSSRFAYGEMRKVNGTQWFSRTFDPGETFEVSLPQNGAHRIVLTESTGPKGGISLSGISAHFR